MEDHMREDLRRAIAIATAAQTNDKAERGEASGVIVRQFLEEDPAFEVNIMIGLTNLVTILLVKLEKETGRPGTEILEEIARRYTL